MNLKGFGIMATSALMAGSVCFAANLSRADQQFMFKAAEGAMAEQQIGQMAQQKSNNPAIQKFGERLYKDHSTAANQLNSLAGKMGVNLPTKLEGARQAEVQKLSRLSGPQFDKVFLKWTVQDHQKSINLFQREAQAGTNPELKGFAAGMVVDLKDHLTTAQNLRQNGALNASNRMPNSANREMNEANLQPGQQHVVMGTVTNYQANQTLTVKQSGRAGV